MSKQIFSTRFPVMLLALIVVLLTGSSNAFASATMIIINADGPNEGFNDPTPAAPVGGNPGTTLGQQRLIAFQFAADIWGATLDSPEPIYIVAAFNPLPANVLGSAGAWDVFSDFAGSGLYPGSEFPQTWYGSALADKRAGRDMDTSAPDISAQFSSNFNFYLGLDNQHGPLNDLVAVLLHEFGHGLGFQNFVNESTGTELGGFTDGGRFYPVQPDIYERHTRDISTGKYWVDMTVAERQASAVNWGKVAWDKPGSLVNAALPSVLSFGNPFVNITAPAAIADTYQLGTASFGSAIPLSGISGSVVRAVDAANVAGPSTFDACTPLTNAAAVAGKIAFVDRGTCGFVVKAKTVQDAGAIGVIIANTTLAQGAPPGMGGVDPTVTLVAVSFNQADGDKLRTQFNNNVPVTGAFGLDQTVRAGATLTGLARLNAPSPVVSGSSGSHYDPIASRNLLMEPSINPDLTHNLKAPDDLTLELLRDIGWFADADLDGLADDLDCDSTSDLGATIVIDGCNTGVPNTLFTNGCTIFDLIQQIAAGSKNHGNFVSGVANLTNQLKKSGLITGAQKEAIQSCASNASIP